MQITVKTPRYTITTSISVVKVCKNTYYLYIGNVVICGSPSRAEIERIMKNLINGKKTLSKCHLRQLEYFYYKATFRNT